MTLTGDASDADEAKDAERESVRAYWRRVHGVDNEQVLDAIEALVEAANPCGCNDDEDCRCICHRDHEPQDEALIERRMGHLRDGGEPKAAAEAPRTPTGSGWMLHTVPQGNDWMRPDYPDRTDIPYREGTDEDDDE